MYKGVLKLLDISSLRLCEKGAIWCTFYDNSH